VSILLAREERKTAGGSKLALGGVVAQSRQQDRQQLGRLPLLRVQPHRVDLVAEPGALALGELPRAQAGALLGLGASDATSKEVERRPP